MRILIGLTLIIVGWVFGLVFGWNIGRQNLIEEINESRQRLRRNSLAITEENDDYTKFD